MTLAKLNFAAMACFLLCASGLLISCNEIKPSNPTKPVDVSTLSSAPLCVDTAGIIAIEMPSKICKKSVELKEPKDHEEKSPDCIHPDLQA